MTQGVFITLEGGEGAGKSTLIRKITTWLESKNIPILATREPGGTPEAEAIRSLVVQGSKDRFDPMGEALLFNAARRHHLQQKILPALNAGTWVICDRFLDSTFVYQGYVQGVELSFLTLLHQQACNNCLPTLTFLIDIPVDIGLYRANKRITTSHENRFEQNDHQFHEAVRSAFIHLSKAYSKRFVVLDGTLSEHTLFEEAINHLRSYIPDHQQ